MQGELISKRSINTFTLVVAYGLFIFCLQMFLYKIGITTVWPGTAALRSWDAAVYEEVSKIGYYYVNEQKSNGGVFILFPWVWHLLHVGIVGISMVNLLFFATGLTILTNIYPVNSNEKVLWLTTPSLYFMWVPYTEALFCMLTCIIFYAIVNQKKWLMWACLFIVSLCRPTAVFLIPSLLAMELLTNDREAGLKVFGSYLLNYALPTIAGNVAFVLVQYYYMGVWFPYYIGQSKYLGHKFSMPKLPFCTFYGGERITWLCAYAMIPCVIALILLGKKSYEWLFKNKKSDDKIWVLTLCYLPIILFVMIFFNPKWGSGTTHLLGIHRYVFCSPFIFVFLYQMVSKPQTYKLKHFIFIFALCNIVFLSMLHYTHIQKFIFYNFITALVLAYMYHSINKRSWVVMAICAFNLLIQVSLFNQFMHFIFTE